MRITIVTDAWHPQANGVVRVNNTLRLKLEEMEHEVQVIEPSRFSCAPCPTYPEIPLALLPGRSLRRMIDTFCPDAIHIATEGPLGLAARALCKRRRWPFTTAYHTKFPEYINARFGLPLDGVYAAMRWFHKPSQAVLCPSPSLARDLSGRGFANAIPWCHGVDTQLFHPQPKDFIDLPRPVFLYVGRITVEKNLPAFLDLDLPGSKVVVGTGPQREVLERRYPDVRFFTAFGDRELSRYYASADAFVFPSRTDTFGLVMLEALACGVPVAAYPVSGPLDVLGDSEAGAMDEDLAQAALKALTISPDIARAYAERFSWDAVAAQFLDLIVPIAGHGRRKRARHPAG